MPNPKTRDKLSSVDTGKSFSGLMAHRQSASFRAVYQKRLTEKNINESNKIELNDKTTTSTVQQRPNQKAKVRSENQKLESEGTSKNGKTASNLQKRRVYCISKEDETQNTSSIFVLFPSFTDES